MELESIDMARTSCSEKYLGRSETECRAHSRGSTPWRDCESPWRLEQHNRPRKDKVPVGPWMVHFASNSCKAKRFRGVMTYLGKPSSVASRVTQMYGLFGVRAVV